MRYFGINFFFPATMQKFLVLIIMWFLQGESVDDCGGGYSESIAEMCDELQNGSLNLLIATPNGRDEAGTSRDCYLLNPALSVSNSGSSGGVPLGAAVAGVVGAAGGNQVVGGGINSNMQTANAFK